MKRAPLLHLLCTAGLMTAVMAPQPTVSQEVRIFNTVKSKLAESSMPCQTAGLELPSMRVFTAVTLAGAPELPEITSAPPLPSAMFPATVVLTMDGEELFQANIPPPN